MIFGGTSIRVHITHFGSIRFIFESRKYSPILNDLSDDLSHRFELNRFDRGEYEEIEHFSLTNVNLNYQMNQLK